MSEILYYPLIDCDTDGTEKVAMIPTTDLNTVKAQSGLWLEEVVPRYYRLYKDDGTPVTITKKYNVILQGGHHRFTFKDCGKLADFFNKHHFSLKPTITVS